jgi:DNA invertase Pin-like site-specific DNA recombinase
MKVALYCRVSTNDQHNLRQINDLSDLVKSQGWVIEEIITEYISGAKQNIEREGINQVLQLAAAGKIDKVVVTEISRLGRKVSQVIEIIEKMADYNVSIYIQNIGMETLLPNGKENIMFKPILVTLAGFAEMERELLRERIISGMKTAKRQGKNIGRPTGTAEQTDVLEKYPKVVKGLKLGLSIRGTADFANVSSPTVQKVKKAMMA